MANRSHAPRSGIDPLDGLRGLAALLLIGLSFVVRTAHAEERPRNPALADKLFEAGRRELAAGRHAEACQAFEASQAAEPSVGALLNVARCHELANKTATAWAEYRAAATLAGQRGEQGRRQGAIELIDRLEPRLSRLSVELSPQHATVVVEVDGQAVPSVALGVPFPVDPGEHTIAARAEGHVPWRSSVVVTGEGTRTTVLVPRLTEARGSVATKAALARGGAETGYAQRVAGLIVAGVGLGGVVAGAVEAGRALALDSTLEGLCGPLDASGTRPCPATLEPQIAATERAGNVASVLLGAGGALAVTGVTLFFTAPPGEAAKPVAIGPVVGPGTLGLVARASF